MAYTITWEPSGAWIRYSGEFSNTDLVDSMRDMIEYPDFPTLRYYVVTAEPGISLSDITTDALQQVAALHRQASATNPNVHGITISQSKLSKGLMAVYWNWHEAHGGRWTLEVVASEDEVRARVAELLADAPET